MKIPSLLLLTAVLLLPLRAGAQQSDKPAAPADLQIISAVYGSGTGFADVSTRVTELLGQATTTFFARPQWLNADPTPGWNKALVIIYLYKGKRQIFTTGEGGETSADILRQEADRKEKPPVPAVDPAPTPEETPLGDGRA